MGALWKDLLSVNELHHQMTRMNFDVTNLHMVEVEVEEVVVVEVLNLVELVEQLMKLAMLMVEKEGMEVLMIFDELVIAGAVS